MSERHTAEPWLVTHQSGGDWDVVAGTNIGVGMCVATCGKCLADDCGPGANARRIVACVNACAGMSDPAAELAALRAEREELREALRELVEDGECYCADNVAARGPCGHCKARAALARAERKA